VGEVVAEWKEKGAITWQKNKCELKQLLHDSDLINEVADEDEVLKEMLGQAAPDSSRFVNSILKEG